MELRRWLVSEIVAPTLTLSAFCDTELGSVFQSRVTHLKNCGICQSRNSRSLSERIHSVANPRFSHVPLL